MELFHNLLEILDIDAPESIIGFVVQFPAKSSFIRQLSSVSPTAILFFIVFILRFICFCNPLQDIIDVNNDMYRLLLTCTLLVFCRFLQPLAIVWSTYSQSWQRISKRLIWRLLSCMLTCAQCRLYCQISHSSRIYDCSFIYKLWMLAINRCAISYCDNRYTFSHFRNNWPQSHLFSYFTSVSINEIPKQLSLFSNRCYLLYDNPDDFAFLIINLPFISSYIAAASVYRVYISQLTRYSRVCNFLERAQLQ